MLTDLSPFIYGTTRLGDDQIPFDDRVKIANAAMKEGVWFHTSHTYDNALDVLGTAFNQDRAKIPKLIIKIGWDSIDEIRNTVRQNLEPLGLNKLDIGQLCLGDKLAKDFANGGKCYEGFQKLRDEGLVERFVLEVFPWTSVAPLRALQHGYPEGIIEALSNTADTTAIKAAEIAVGLGNIKTMNVVLLGALVKAMGLTEINWEDVIKETVKPKFVDINIKAMQAGMEMI